MSFSRRHETLAAAVLLSLPVTVVLADALFGGGLLVPGGFLYTVLPWSTRAPANIAALNPELSDVPLQMYPWALFARPFLRAGEVPVWNPLVLSGTPFFSNAQAAMFGPFNLPVWILPVRVGLALGAFLKLWFGGLGAYLLARRLKCGFWSALVAGVAFSLCAFNVLWLAHGVHVAVAVLLPWGVLLCERLLSDGRPRDALLLSIVIAAAALGGHPGTFAHLLGALGVYAIARGLMVEALTGRERAGRLMLVGLGALLGLGLAAFFLIPVGLSSSGTVGALERMGGSFTLPDFAFVSAAFPDWWGRPTGVATDGLNHFPPVVKGGLFQERTLYAGVVSLVLAVIALVAPGQWRRKLPFVVLGALGLCVAFGVPVVHWLFTHLPGFDRARDARMTLWFQFSVVMLAAIGLQALAERRIPMRRLLVVAAAAVIVSFVALVTVGPGWSALSSAAGHFASGGAPRGSDAVALVAIAWWVFFAGLVLGMAIFMTAKRSARVAAICVCLIAVVVAADMVRFAHGYQPAAKPSIAAPGRTPLIDFLVPRQSAGRTVMFGGGLLSDGLPADYGMRFGLRAVRGYDPPQPDAAYNAVLKILGGLSRPGGDLLAPRSALDALGARWVVVAHGAPPPAGAGPGLVAVHGAPDGDVYENPTAVGRVRVATRLLPVATLGGALAALASPERRIPGSAIVEVPAGRLPEGMPTASAGSAQVSGETNDSVSLAAVLDRPGLVVLDDRLVDGWTVKVDGRPAKPVRVDAVMRGVFAGAGMHTIEWTYEVPGLSAGIAVSGVSVVIWLLAFALLSRRRPRHRRRARGPRDEVSQVHGQAAQE